MSVAPRIGVLHLPPAEVCGAVRGAHRVALLCHVNPDADALAGVAALTLTLPTLGITPVPVLPEHSASQRMERFARRGGVVPGLPVGLGACDLAIVFDTAKPERINVPGKLAALAGVPLVNIDHHATNPGFGQWNWIVPAASSTSELVYGLLVGLGATLSAAVATLLYAGLAGDTQGFSLANTGTGSLAVAHALTLAGADVAGVCEELFRSQTAAEFALLKTVYANTRIGAGGALGWSTVTHAEILEAGCTAQDIDDQVEIVRRVEGVRVAILFSEGTPGRVRMNFRGEQGVSVLPLAEQFGGGGHYASAGAVVDSAFEAVLGRVLPAAEQFVRGP